MKEESRFKSYGVILIIIFGFAILNLIGSTIIANYGFTKGDVEAVEKVGIKQQA